MGLKISIASPFLEQLGTTKWNGKDQMSVEYLKRCTRVRNTAPQSSPNYHTFCREDTDSEKRDHIGVTYQIMKTGANV